jgi:hypothetical protein
VHSPLASRPSRSKWLGGSTTALTNSTFPQSLLRRSKRARVTAQLIDAETDAHLWAERFNRDTDDLFALQTDITSRIAVALNLELTGRDAARPTDNPDALDYILRGRAAYWKPASREQRTETISLFERALALDPGSVEAKSSLANELAARAIERADPFGR